MLFRTVRTRWVYIVGCGVLVLFVAFFHTPYKPATDSLVVIEEGESLTQIAHTLSVQGVVTSSVWFRVATTLVGGAHAMKAGVYRFSDRERFATVIIRLMRADYGVAPVRVVFFEGSTAYEMSKVLAKVIDPTEAERFADIAEQYEGSLFPDTYFFAPNVTAEEVVRTLRTTFTERARQLKIRAAMSGHTWNEILTMASIIEEEVRTPKDRRMVSGIMWKRIEAGMPLQVDASFSYLFGKSSDEVTKKDIATDSPYNTYKYKGLPPTPITNPGLDSIEAALEPSESEYWFYLSDAHGTSHFARTYREHLQNKAMYID